MVLQFQKAKEELDFMQAQVLGAVNYDGMPHAHEVSRTTERLAIFLEQQISDVNRLRKIVEESEAAVSTFINGIEDNHIKVIFSLRFLCGFKWESVASMIGGGNTEQSVKNTCYRYLEKMGDKSCDGM